MAERSAIYLDALRREFPRLRLIDKRDDGFSRLVDGALRVVTFGGQSAYLTRYVTTMGQTIYLPAGWAEREDLARYCVLRHEAVHLRQFRRFGRVGMALLYLLPLWPLGLAWGRARLEWEAYTETLAATWELLGPERASDPRLRHEVVRRFTGPDYGWMWPFPSRVQRWYDQALEQIEQNSRLAHEGTLPVGPEFAIASSAVRSRSPTHPQSEEPS